MHRLHLPWIAAGLLLLTAGRAEAAPATIDPDSVKGVAVAYAEAFAKADVATMRKLSIGTEASHSAAENIAGMLVAVGQLQAAAATKFGPDNPFAGRVIGPMPDLIADVKASEFVISDDAARQSDKRTDTRRPMTLVRVNSTWKVDLQSLAVDPSAAARHAATATRIFIEATAEIRAGVYPDANAAVRVIGPRLLNALR